MRSSDPATPHFLDPHDLAVAKLGAARAKDLEFVDALLREHMLDLAVLRERGASLPDEHVAVREWILSFLASRSV